MAADCYLIKGDQVSKTPESGEFLKKGGFVIRGERRYFKDVPLGIALGIAERSLDRRAGIGRKAQSRSCGGD